MSLFAQIISCIYLVGALLLILAPFLLYAICGAKSCGDRIFSLLLVVGIAYGLVIEPIISRRSDSPTASVAQAAAEEPRYRYIDGKLFDMESPAWYTTYGKSFHTSRSCGHLTKSSNIEPTSTIGEAIKAGKGDPCDYCAFD